MQYTRGGVLFALTVGIIVALLSYRWITDPAPQQERQRQERAVIAARTELQSFVQAGPLEIVDPLAPQRPIGKVYIYPLAEGWEVSGYYRRNAEDAWHPYLARISPDFELAFLKVSDQDLDLLRRADADPRVEILP